MATINKQLENLKLDEIFDLSVQYLLGFRNFGGYKITLKGLNKKREQFGLKSLTTNWSDEYRIEYILSNYTQNEIELQISDYMINHHMENQRWKGIYLFGCRFGREYARLFKILLGNKKYRELSEKARQIKTDGTCCNGRGLADKKIKDKAIKTNLKKYGVKNVMQSDVIQQQIIDDRGYLSPFNDKSVYKKGLRKKQAKLGQAIIEFKRTGILDKKVFNIFSCELVVFEILIDIFGINDVYYQYGLHPYDKRYPYACDFYIKSLDLFIEINAHYSHHTHWYDCNNVHDIARYNDLQNSSSKKVQNSLNTWCDKDIEKRNVAQKNKINYLVFWDGTIYSKDKVKYPRLSDFYKWVNDYNCDYQSFIKDYPENTY